MRLCVIGLGKLGSPLAAVLASKGHSVTGLDRNPDFVAAINQGQAPVTEPGLQALIDEARPRLRATASFTEAIAGADASFVIVPTPSQEDGAFSNKYVLEAVTEIGRALRGSDRYHVVSIVSTVMPGATGGVIRAALEEAAGRKVGDGLGLCYNPEFIALGSVVRDLLQPDMVLLGESDTKAGDLVEAVQRSVSGAPVLRMNLVNAEIAKLALNSYVTMKISFANMLAEMCERVPGADVQAVTGALGKDSRIGAKYLTGALGYGGPCFPRDNAALRRWADGLKVSAELPLSTDAVNRRQAARIAAMARAALTPGGKVAILGLAYKPQTPVIEESQGVMIAAELAAGNVPVVVHDGLALDNARAVLGEGVHYAERLEDAVAGAQVVIIAVPHPDFRQVAQLLAARTDHPVVLDCWRLLPPASGSFQLVHVGKGGFLGQ
jgi:UDPglucose 6-dehydrogenase